MNFSNILGMARGGKLDAGTTATLTATPATDSERIAVAAEIQKLFSRPPSVHVPVQIYSVTASEMGRPMLSPDAFAAGSLLTMEWESGASQMNDLGKDRVAAAHADAQHQVGEDLIAGKPVADAWNKSDVAADFARRVQALKGALRERSLEAGRIFAESIEPLVAALDAKAEALAIEDFRLHARYNVEFQPSAVVRAFLSASANLKRLAERYSTTASVMGVNPREMFRILGVEFP